MSFKDLALDAVLRGFFVFPLVSDSKLPALKEWQKRATQDLAQIDMWDEENPDYNIGFFTGKFLPPGEKEPTTLIVVDIDVKEGKRGRESALQLELEGFDFTQTLEQRTPTGGSHLIYRYGRGVSGGSERPGPGIDVRSNGGYIVGHGSTIQGKPYAFKNPSLRPEIAPEWLVQRCLEAKPDRKITPEEKRAIKFLKDAKPAIEFNGGNHFTLKLAMELRDKGITQSKALELMLEHWNERCEPPWSLSELSTIVGNAFKYAKDSFANKAPALDFEKIEPKKEDEKLDPIQELNKEYAYVLSGNSGHILWETEDADGKAMVQHLDVKAFHEFNAAKTIQFGDSHKPMTKLWMNDKCRRTYRGFCFKPEKKVPPGWYNLWRGFAVKPSSEKGETHESVRAFLEHAEQNVCKGDKELTRWLLGYFAHLIQKPWEKPLTALVFKGKKGVGKGALVGRVGHLLGSSFRVGAKKRALVGNFNAHLENSLMMVLDEAFWSGDVEANGILKDLVTGDTHSIERKGKDIYELQNLTRVVVMGNEDWLVPASEDERRYAVFNVGDGRIDDPDFFEDMRVGMEAGGYSYLLRYFLDYDISGLNFRVAPKTEGLLEQKVASLPPVQEWWFKCLKDEVIDEALDVWPADISRNFVRDTFYEHLKAKNFRSRYPDPRAIGKELRKVCPSVKSHQPKIEGCRRREYQIPPIEKCREEWEQFIGHRVKWDD